MSDRHRRLNNIMVGDIIHATSEAMPSLICLVVSTTDSAISVRTVTTQIRLEFDRRTGEATWQSVIDGESIRCTIDSVAPLPVGVHNTLLGLDRKIRLGGNAIGNPLDDEEISAVLFIDSFYPSNPL